MRGRNLHDLTERERQVLDLLRRDFTNEQISQRLGITLDGAKYHVSQILSKLGVGSREEAAAVVAGERRRWWLTAPLWAKIAGGVTVAAAVGGLAVLALGVIRTEGEGPSTVLASPTIDATAPLSSTPATTLPPVAVLPTRCSNPLGTESSEAGRGNLSFDPYKSGTDSYILFTGTFDATEVWKIDSVEVWQEFWAAHTNQVSPRPAPPFDFSDCMLIAVVTFANTGGYSIRINEIIEATSELQVIATRHELGKDCLTTLAVTQPYDIVSATRSSRVPTLTTLSEQGPACTSP